MAEAAPSNPFVNLLTGVFGGVGSILKWIFCDQNTTFKALLGFILNTIAMQHGYLTPEVGESLKLGLAAMAARGVVKAGAREFAAGKK